MANTMTDKLQRTTTFNLAEYAGDHNGYDRGRLHPMSHNLVVRSPDGTERTITVGQLETFLRYAEHHEHMGSALDAVARPVADKLKLVG